MGKITERKQRNRTEFLKKLSAGAKVAEVGVWKGDFSQTILDLTEPAELHLIDPWQFHPEFPGRFYGGSRSSGQADMDAIQQSVRDRFQKNPEVTVHALPSTEAAKKFADGYFDWVYIDGDHSYQAVLDDLRAWAPKVRQRGLLIGDDFNWKDEQGSFAVMRAVVQFSNEQNHRLQSMRHDQFVFRLVREG